MNDETITPGPTEEAYQGDPEDASQADEAMPPLALQPCL